MPDRGEARWRIPKNGREQGKGKVDSEISTVGRRTWREGCASAFIAAKGTSPVAMPRRQGPRRTAADSCERHAAAARRRDGSAGAARARSRGRCGERRRAGGRGRRRGRGDELKPRLSTAEDESERATETTTTRKRRRRGDRDRRAPKRGDDEPASFLAMYFRDMAELDVLRPEQEFETARNIEEMELDLWRTVVGFAPGDQLDPGRRRARARQAAAGGQAPPRWPLSARGASRRSRRASRFEKAGAQLADQAAGSSTSTASSSMRRWPRFSASAAPRKGLPHRGHDSVLDLDQGVRGLRARRSASRRSG